MIGTKYENEVKSAVNSELYVLTTPPYNDQSLIQHGHEQSSAYFIKTPKDGKRCCSSGKRVDCFKKVAM